LKILVHSDLDPGRLRAQYDKVVGMLARDDFYSAEVKKLADRDLYRAKLDYSNRLLFRIARHGGERYALLLEVVENHAYEKSRFLRGARVDEASLLPVVPAQLPEANLPALPYVNPSGIRFNLLDKALSFDEAQEALYRLPSPLVIVGSAGSGKTALTLEKVKLAAGDVLYVTRSAFLARHARDLYFANGYENEAQNIDFFSFRELLESIHVPAGREAGDREFRAWHARQPQARAVPAHVVRGIQGVLTGLATDQRSSRARTGSPWASSARSSSTRSAPASTICSSAISAGWGVGPLRFQHGVPVLSRRSEAALRLCRRRGADITTCSSRSSCAYAPGGRVSALRRLQPDRPSHFFLGASENAVLHHSALDPASLVHVRARTTGTPRASTTLPTACCASSSGAGLIDREATLVETASLDAGTVGACA
jgi:hypothetical protein